MIRIGEHMRHRLMSPALPPKTGLDDLSRSWLYRLRSKKASDVRNVVPGIRSGKTATRAVSNWMVFSLAVDFISSDQTEN